MQSNLPISNRHHNETKDKEHQRNLACHKIIEDHKEYLKRLNTSKYTFLCNVFVHAI